MSSRMALVWLSLVGTLTGCSGSTEPNPDDLKLNPQQASYAPGGTAVFTLANGLDQRIGYNGCFHSLQREDNGAWVDVASESTTCQDFLTFLDAGASADVPIALVASLPAGTYRVSLYQLRIFPDNEPFPSIHSTPFTVAP